MKDFEQYRGGNQKQEIDDQIGIFLVKGSVEHPRVGKAVVMIIFLINKVHEGLIQTFQWYVTNRSDFQNQFLTYSMIYHSAGKLLQQHASGPRVELKSRYFPNCCDKLIK